MVFQFKSVDNLEELHPAIAKHLPRFIENRMDAFKKFENAINDNDLEQIRSYCHGQIGVAASYNCHQLHEITLYIQDHARNQALNKIIDMLPVLNEYLNNLKNRIDA